MNLDEKNLKKKIQGEDPDPELKTPGELVEDWAKAIEGDLERPLTTCISKIDKDLRNKLRGTVGAYIGYGGTKKSLLALQACRTNVIQHKNNCTGIYSNMEMAIFQSMSRIIDMSIENVPEYEACNPSFAYELMYNKEYKAMNKKQLEAIKEVVRELLNKMYGNNLYISNKTGMTVTDYDRILSSAKKRNGVVDMLVIDGLSMMAGVGNETETYTTNSKELKDLAKLHNVYIALICHLSKGAEKHTREVQRFIRGSEKILDNVDFVIQMSLVIDASRSTPETIEYLTNKGYIRFFNKRGSGNTINVVYEFNKKNLTIIESEEDPMNVEVDLKKKQNFF